MKDCCIKTKAPMLTTEALTDKITTNFSKDGQQLWAD